MAKPMRCARCGRENDPSFAFCLDCGQPLPRAVAEAPAPQTPSPSLARCPGCGTRLQGGFRFCAQCGRAVPPAATPPPSAPAAVEPEPPHGTFPARLAPAPHPTMALAAAAPALRVTVVRHDGATGPSFALDRAQAICGRSEVDIRLADDATVSPRHLKFTCGDGTVAVEDLGTVNGTFLRLRGPHRLAIGEELRVGRQLLRLEPIPRPAAADVRPWGAPDPGHRLRLAQLLEGGGLGEIFPLRPGENTIGREAGDLTFPSDRYVSARHARVDVDDAEATVTDVGSSNGTFVKLVGPTPLTAGDQLLVGSQLLRVDAA
jgi:pSer/pThr/pTyr-binding forkhead associated (FHA) protein/DNA-directed RNA polymerase subunit RPC12/RpoP